MAKKEKPIKVLEVPGAYPANPFPSYFQLAGDLYCNVVYKWDGKIEEWISVSDPLAEED